VLAVDTIEPLTTECVRWGDPMAKILLTLFALCIVTVAQKTDDADKQKLIDIEQKIAATTSFNSPETVDLLQKYLYDGNTSVVVTFGHLSHVPKAEVVDFAKKPDPSDPDVRSITKLSDFQVDTYADTALVSYKLTATESGHKLPALNGDYHLTCLDTFLKRTGQWYMIGSACVPSAPISQAQWDADKQRQATGNQQKPPSQ
jgi:hypothetical protein